VVIFFQVDHQSGEIFELGRLAPETYKRVLEETKAIQAKMKDMFATGEPKDQEVVVLYQDEENEKNDVKNDAAGKRKRVIEMEKPRPQFFSSNLMQKTQVKSDGRSSTTVRPSGLG
jgi:large subunit ribosomal protein L32